MTRPTIVLFDIDGTLVTCGGAGRLAMQEAFRVEVGREDVVAFSYAGATDRAIVRRGLRAAGVGDDAATIDRVLSRYLVALDAALAEAESFAVLPGVVEAISALSGRPGLALGLGTGNVERGARAKLRRGALDERFGFGGFGCDHEERARLLEAGAERGARALGVARADCRVRVIGDTPKDVAAARAIGAECLAVATGRPSAEELHAAAPDLVVRDLTTPDALTWLLA